MRGGGFCPACGGTEREKEIQRQNDAERPTAAERGYCSPQWRRLRAAVLARDGVCRMCQREPATECDHIVPKSQGGTDDMENLQGLCSKCHKRKTASEDGGFGNPRKR